VSAIGSDKTAGSVSISRGCIVLVLVKDSISYTGNFSVV